MTRRFGFESSLRNSQIHSACGGVLSDRAIAAVTRRHASKQWRISRRSGSGFNVLEKERAPGGPSAGARYAYATSERYAANS